MVGSNYYVGYRQQIAIKDALKDGVYDYFELFKNQLSPNHSSTTVVNKKKFLITLLSEHSSNHDSNSSVGLFIIICVEDNIFVLL